MNLTALLPAELDRWRYDPRAQAEILRRFRGEHFAPLKELEDTEQKLEQVTAEAESVAGDYYAECDHLANFKDRMGSGLDKAEEQLRGLRERLGNPNASMEEIKKDLEATIKAISELGWLCNE